jgi:nucleoside-diphosphate-sugar epimerase
VRAACAAPEDATAAGPARAASSTTIPRIATRVAQGVVAMKLLITGAAGRVGRALRARLQGEHAVLGLDRVPAPGVDRVGDLADTGLLTAALQGVDAVLHCAALHAPHVGHAAEAEFQRVNVDATLALWRAAHAAGVRRFVFTSTTALYGCDAAARGHAAWITETTVPRPRSVYHRSKLAAEQALREAACGGGPAVTVLRMSRCFPEPAPLMAANRLHRGNDERHVAAAHALARAGQAPPAWRCFVISGATPFAREDTERLWRDAPALLRERLPALAAAFDQRGWLLPASIDRVYVPEAATQGLGWRPRHGWEAVLQQADAGSPEVLSAAPSVESAACH